MPLKSSPHHQGKPHGQLNFKTDENQGRMTIAPKDLTIVWGRDERYWKSPKEDNDPAELYQVCWLEVTGCVNQTDPTKDYEVGFLCSMNPDAFGWGSAPVFVAAKRGKKGKFIGKNKLLNGSDTDIKVTLKADPLAKKPLGDPKETKVAEDSAKDSSGNPKEKASEGSAQDSSEDRKVYFGLYEVSSGKWKGGLKIHKAFIREL